MKADLEIFVYEVCGNTVCVASGDGQKVFERLAAAFKENEVSMLSFQNVSMLTSAF